MSKPDESDYALETAEVPLVDAPVLNYRPPRTRSYAPGIAVVGAGGISFAHLDAYRSAGYDVRVICNRTLSKAIERATRFSRLPIFRMTLTASSDATISMSSISRRTPSRGRP
ncbi:hypothetical protein [Sinorhizobium medicae]|uniref:hypothetical protein n=1 Tax=Sinorhizobium medicae TaxID=110321 RepID=UPI001F3DD5C9|nr:hypothetical protein [Sinorhizobium medicae]